MVDVQHQHRQLPAAALAALQLAFQLVQDAAPRVGLRQAVERQRGLHLFRLAGLDHEKQRQKQPRHRDGAAHDEEQAPRRRLQQRHRRFHARAVDIHAQRVQSHQPEEGQQQIEHDAFGLDAPPLPEDDPARCRHQHAGVAGIQHHSRQQTVVAIQQQRKAKRAQRAQHGRAQDVRMQAEELAHADVHQRGGHGPGRVGHHHIGRGRHHFGARVGQHRQHGQRIGRHERGHAFDAAAMKWQQQRQRQRRGESPHQEKQASRHGCSGSGLLDLPRRWELQLHWVRNR